jgi:hypothetical protein
MTQPIRTGRPVVSIDASSLRGDGFAWLVAQESSSGLIITKVSAIEGAELRRHSMTEIVAMVAADARAAGARVIYGDQRESASLASLFAAEGLAFTSFAWSEPSKDTAFQTLRRLLRERQLHLCSHAGLRKEMLECKAHLRPSGRTHYQTNGLDFLSALVTLMHAIDAHNIRPTIPAQVGVFDASARIYDGSPAWSGWPGDRGY